MSVTAKQKPKASKPKAKAKASKPRKKSVPEVAPGAINPTERAAAAQTLQERYFGLSIGFTWFGVDKALTKEQKATAASALSIEDETMLKGARRKFDTKNELWTELATIRRELYMEWREFGLPFPVSGVRLFPRDRFDYWNDRIQKVRGRLEAAAERLQNAWPEIVADARRKLGPTFDPKNYPTNIAAEFSLLVDFPSLDPPEYLRTMSPKVYEEQCEAVKGRFLEAVTQAEAAALDALNKLLSNLAERLNGVDENGRPKQVREAAIENLSNFVAWFRTVSIKSSAELEELVGRVEGLATTNLETVKDNAELRAEAGRLAEELRQSAAAMILHRPIRKITMAGLKAAQEEAGE